jgi:DNA-directed RNA polymerase omega subunit
MMKLPLEELEKMNLNRYEAVIVASRHARRLNVRRLKSLQQLEQDPSLKIDSRKMTMVALKDLIEQKVKFTRPDTM